jgi:outer membrane protein assembly factor BamB
LTDGQPVWQQHFERAVIGGLAVTSESLAVVSLTSTDLLYGVGGVVALGADGKVRWRWAPGVQQVSAPVVFRDLIGVTVDATTLVLLDAATGQERRRMALEGVASLEAPCFTGEWLLVPCRAPSLLALELDGRVRWHFTGAEDANAWLDRTPVAAGNHCFVVLSTGVAFAVTLADGKLLWRADVGPAGKRLSAPATDGSRLYVGAQDGLYALDCETGKPAWPAFATERRIAATPLVAGERVYAACHDHVLYVLDARTGKELWHYEGERRIEQAPVLAACGADERPCVIAVDRQGAVMAVERSLDAAESEAAGQWVQAALACAAGGNFARGAELLDVHEEPFKAAELWKAGGDLERAAASYERAAAWQQAADVWAGLGRPLKQAQALEHLAQSLAGRPGEEKACADLWGTVARLYEDEGDEVSLSRCRREAARCLEQPIITFAVKPVNLVEESWSSLEFVMRNEGYGAARNLIIHVTGDEFEGQIASTRQITTLRPGKEKSESLDVRPLEHGNVPLRLQVEYCDRSNVSYKVPYTLYIPVASKAALGGMERMRIDTGGGAVIVGNVSTGGGDFVGRDRVTPVISIEPRVASASPAAAQDAGLYFADLEIRIFPRQERGYPVEMTLDDQLEFPLGYLAGGVLPWISSGDFVADGERLFEWLLSDDALRDAWNRTLGRSQKRRIRLRIDAAAPELHTLPWELLRAGRRLVSASADTPFSRYLAVLELWGESVVRRPIRVLAAISNPGNLQEYGLTPVDVTQERTLLENALAGLGADEIILNFLEPPVTLARLEEKLREGCHVVHYVGHGFYNAKRQQAALYLQDGKGDTEPVPDGALSEMMARQGVRPQLVFLAACQSAATSTADAFLGLAPKLVMEGVPAVVAMQGLVTVETARRFGAECYRRLAKHGLIDLAVNEARSALVTAGRPDAGVPVLFMRLKSGKVWER